MTVSKSKSKMRYRFTIIIALFILTRAGAQVYHTCPLDGHSVSDFENPLNEKWLSAYDVKFYDLQLSVSNTSTEIFGTVSILLESVRDMDTLVLELHDSLYIQKVRISDENSYLNFENITDFQHLNHAIFIPLNRIRTRGDRFYIFIEYEGVAGHDRGFFGGVTTATDPTYGFDVTYTLSEPLNAKNWFPVKQVLSDKIDSAWISLQCDDHLMAGSVGVLFDIIPGEENTHTFKWRTRYPIAYYLLSFAVADYRDFSFNAALSEEGDSVIVQNFIYDSDSLFSEWEERIRATGSMITAFSNLLIDYPFSEEKYGHAMAPMGGGMEHQTMTTIHNFNFYLVAHELAHQWFGDHITCENWQDIWINEGFASYMEYVAAQQLRGQEFANGWMANAMSIALGEISGSVYVPEESVVDTYRLFDYGLTYKKGAILLHMIRYQLDDDDLFFNVLRSYLDQFGNGLARGEDFRGILEAESGVDFSCFFDQWYYGEGYPRFNIHWMQEGDSIKITSEQVATAPEVTPIFYTPFDLEIRLTGGAIHRIRLMQDEQVEKFSVATEGLVADILFDPDGWLLKTASVIQKLPANRRYAFGPNPVEDALYIRLFNNTPNNEVKITNMSGQKLLGQKFTENPVRMDLSSLADGPYVLVIQDSEQTYMERIVKVNSN